MLGAMLGAHSKCIAIPESQWMIELLAQAKVHPENLERIWKKIQDHWRYKIWNFTPPSSPRSSRINSYAQLIHWIAAQYGEQFGKSNMKYWIDHTGSNVKHAAKLLELFPNAKFIHLIRDGRSVANSLMSCDWGPNTILACAHYWQSEITYGLAAESYLKPERIIQIRYEDLVEKPSETTHQLGDFLNLPFEAHLLQPQGFQVPDYSRRQHSLIGKELNESRINAWRETLSARQIELFESASLDLLQYLGYSPIHEFPRTATPAENIRLRLTEFFAWIRNSRRWKRRIKKHTYC